MASKGILISVVVLRFLALLLLAGSIVVMAINSFTSSDGVKTTFKDVIAYRYVIATGITGFAYTLVQIPFAIYHASKEKRLIRTNVYLSLISTGDKIIAFLLATGVGAGFAVTFELKRILDAFLDGFDVPGIGDEKSKPEKFLDRGNIATGLLFLGFLCMVVLSVLSSINRMPPTGRGFFG
ncbi:hypothetical protein L1049_006762 [Liquidambar formosana]|uniref:CASP-like protein n=1 Tax=Liquidambar formosana TaxID=63359 RepID=A0AAP0WUM4_LIQFO